MHTGTIYTAQILYLNPAVVLLCAPRVVFTLIVQPGEIRLPVSFKDGNTVITVATSLLTEL